MSLKSLETRLQENQTMSHVDYVVKCLRMAVIKFDNTSSNLKSMFDASFTQSFHEMYYKEVKELCLKYFKIEPDDRLYVFPPLFVVTNHCPSPIFEYKNVYILSCKDGVLIPIFKKKETSNDVSLLETLAPLYDPNLMMEICS